MTISVSREEATAFRLERSHLLKRAPRERLEQVASDVCGIQAQVLSSAELAISARVDGIRVSEVRDAIWKKHTLVKTWAMRGTLHLLAARDYPDYVAALSTRLSPESVDSFDRLRQDFEESEETTQAIAQALDGKNLSRLELANTVTKILGVDPDRRTGLLSGWGAMLQPAAFRGLLCFGPSRGTNVSFVRPDQWIGKWRPVDGDVALKTLLRRFVRAFGPCTRHDFGHWWGWLRGEASRTIFGKIEDEMEEVNFEGRRAWVLSDDVESFNRTVPHHHVRLLPSWDCYTMFYSPRELFIDRANRLTLFSRLQGNLPALVVDGLAAGVWERRVRTKTGNRNKAIHPNQC